MSHTIETETDKPMPADEVGITLRVMSGPVITPELLLAFAEKAASEGHRPADRLAMLIRQDLKVPA